MNSQQYNAVLPFVKMNSKEFWSYEEAVWSMRMQIAYTYVDAHGLASPCLWKK